MSCTPPELTVVDIATPPLSICDPPLDMVFLKASPLLMICDPLYVTTVSIAEPLFLIYCDAPLEIKFDIATPPSITCMVSPNIVLYNAEPPE
jgi:hypothetical protein